jgi:hypothetical protein
MKMKMYVILDKAKPHTENIRDLNLAAVLSFFFILLLHFYNLLKIHKESN